MSDIRLGYLTNTQHYPYVNQGRWWASTGSERASVDGHLVIESPNVVRLRVSSRALCGCLGAHQCDAKRIIIHGNLGRDKVSLIAARRTSVERQGSASFALLYDIWVPELLVSGHIRATDTIGRVDVEFDGLRGWHGESRIWSEDFGETDSCVQQKWVIPFEEPTRLVVPRGTMSVFWNIRAEPGAHEGLRVKESVSFEIEATATGLPIREAFPKWIKPLHSLMPVLNGGPVVLSRLVLWATSKNGDLQAHTVMAHRLPFRSDVPQAVFSAASPTHSKTLAPNDLRRAMIVAVREPRLAQVLDALPHGRPEGHHEDRMAQSHFGDFTAAADTLSKFLFEECAIQSPMIKQVRTKRVSEAQQAYSHYLPELQGIVNNVQNPELLLKLQELALRPAHQFNFAERIKALLDYAFGDLLSVAIPETSLEKWVAKVSYHRNHWAHENLPTADSHRYEDYRRILEAAIILAIGRHLKLSATDVERFEYCLEIASRMPPEPVT